jgi:hypothetical protein
MDAWLKEVNACAKEMKACQEVMEICPENMEADPEEIVPEADLQEVPTKEATVEIVRALEDWSGDRFLALGCC